MIMQLFLQMNVGFLVVLLSFQAITGQENSCVPGPTPQGFRTLFIEACMNTTTGDAFEENCNDTWNAFSSTFARETDRTELQR